MLNPPSQEVWMRLLAQTEPGNVSPGLLHLTTLNKLFVKPTVQGSEVLNGSKTNKRYTIENQNGAEVYYAVENDNCCARWFSGPRRPFEMRILDNYKNEIIHLRREFACDDFCFPCCLQKLEVYCPPSNLVGVVEQKWTFCTPMFHIKNEMGVTVLKIRGPTSCTFQCCADEEFDVNAIINESIITQILSADGFTKKGKISKQWRGPSLGAFTNAKIFEISFSLDLDVRMKAVMIGACILIDFIFFTSLRN